MKKTIKDFISENSCDFGGVYFRIKRDAWNKISDIIIDIKEGDVDENINDKKTD